MPRSEWIALSYLVPTTPSKARVFVWRRLRAIGAQALRPGLAVLPNSKESLTRFKELSVKIKELDGEATIIEMDFVEPRENDEMRLKFSKATESSMRDTLSECASLLDRIKSADPRSRAALEKELARKLERFKKTPAAEVREQASELEAAATDLFETLKGLSAEFSALFRAPR